MHPDSRLKIAAASQEARNLAAAVWPSIPTEEMARIGKIIALLGEVLTREPAIPAAFPLAVQEARVPS